MQHNDFITFLTIPKTRLLKHSKEKGFVNVFEIETTSDWAICPRCGEKTSTKYDRVTQTLRDAPIRKGKVKIILHKRRYLCKPCDAKFRESVPGLTCSARSTERMKRLFTERCSITKSVKAASEEFEISSSTGHRWFMQYLDLENRKRRSPLSKHIGIDEHSFKRNKYDQSVEFVTIIVDHINKRVHEVAMGRDTLGVFEQLKDLKGRENVKAVSLDLSESYLSLCTRLFPNAIAVADRFHVVRLFGRALRKERLKVTGDDRKHPMRELLQKGEHRLTRAERERLNSWILAYPDLSRAHRARQKISQMYRCRNKQQAELIFNEIVDDLSKCRSSELVTLRSTLLHWKEQILNFFIVRITNGRVEGFNKKCKILKRCAYGFKRFDNYRLRILQECA